MHKMIALLSCCTIILLALKTIFLFLILYELPSDWGVLGVYLLSISNCIEPISLMGLFGAAIPEIQEFSHANSLKQVIKDYKDPQDNDHLI